VFTSHLSAIDPRWRKPNGPGEGKTIQWPVGIGGKGNAGVAALIEQTPGALGYIETGYAELTHLPIAALENRSGEFVRPTEESSRLALAEAHFNEVLQAAIHDPQGKKAYPIVTFTWVLCRKKYDNPRVAQALKDVLRFSLTEGQQWSSDLGYIPLPKELAQDFLRTVDQIGHGEHKPEALAKGDRHDFLR
jgi:phosphate transport system substrate-binding protein